MIGAGVGLATDAAVTKAPWLGMTAGEALSKGAMSLGSTLDSMAYTGLQRQGLLLNAVEDGVGNAGKAAEETVSVFRRMSDNEAATTLATQRLQPPAPGANSSKYLSESLDKVIAFQNEGVSLATSESVLEFVLDKSRYQELMSNAVNQLGSKGIDAVKINFEGISDPLLRNIGVPSSKLDAFNDLIVQINKVGP